MVPDIVTITDKSPRPELLAVTLGIPLVQPVPPALAIPEVAAAPRPLVVQREQVAMLARLARVEADAPAVQEAVEAGTVGAGPVTAVEAAAPVTRDIPYSVLD